MRTSDFNGIPSETYKHGTLRFLGCHTTTWPTLVSKEPQQILTKKHYLVRYREFIQWMRMGHLPSPFAIP
ncbi:unnamed protein product [Brugia pahangi]|uniref:Uncharacterized protein n=1 Tax=Brugia pahangi TaxID=6280 RepID=A0A0N4TUB4_BRUPA|nr:unnamed protein product [Brugia pahangi]